jgi:hypothetical protein
VEGNPSFFLSLEDLFSFSWYSYVAPLVNGCKRLPPTAPYMGGRHKNNRVLPGTPRGLLTTLAKFHPGAMQPSVRCLRWTIVLFTIFSDVTLPHDKDARVGFWKGS